MQQDAPAAHTRLQEALATAPKQADVIQLIVEEHNLVKRLYQEYKSSPYAANRQQLITTIMQEVLKHSGKEELFIYPLMSAKLEDGVDQVEHAIMEHKEVRAGIEQLERMDRLSNTREFDALVDKFMSALVHHIDEEERDMLPRLAAKCTEVERIEVGARYQVLEVSTTTLGSVNLRQDETALKSVGPFAIAQTGKEVKPQAMFAGEPR